MIKDLIDKTAIGLKIHFSVLGCQHYRLGIEYYHFATELVLSVLKTLNTVFTSVNQ